MASDLPESSKFKRAVSSEKRAPTSTTIAIACYRSVWVTVWLMSSTCWPWAISALKMASMFWTTWAIGARAREVEAVHPAKIERATGEMPLLIAPTFVEMKRSAVWACIAEAKGADGNASEAAATFAFSNSQESEKAWISQRSFTTVFPFNQGGFFTSRSKDDLAVNAFTGSNRVSLQSGSLVPLSHLGRGCFQNNAGDGGEDRNQP